MSYMHCISLGICSIGWFLGILNARRDLVPELVVKRCVERLVSGNASGPSMRLNENICIVGKSVVLMPYKAEYVPK